MGFKSQDEFMNLKLCHDFYGGADDIVDFVTECVEIYVHYIWFKVRYLVALGVPSQVIKQDTWRDDA